jgi:RNA polymerase sigma factor (sigma-70 family)
MTCRHFTLLQIVIPHARRLSHPDQVERQIEIGQELEGDQLVWWARNPNGPSGFLREETLIFFLLRYRESYLAVELANVLAQRIWTRFRYRYSRDQCEEWQQALWAVILDPSSNSRAWAEVCFWRFAMDLLKNVLKKERRARRAASLDSDLATRLWVFSLRIPGLSLEDALYVREAMAFLTPDQRLAFQLRHEQGFTLSEIGSILCCTDRTVRRLLKIAEARLRIRL